jgi:osmotically-inducible protein OsmY
MTYESDRWSTAGDEIACRCARLFAGIDDSSVHVKVEKGWVTLGGTLRNAYRSRVAEQHIALMRGVTGVTNQIRILGTASPLDIEQSIRRALQRHTERELKHIGIQIDGGKLALSGRVGSYKADRATRARLPCPARCRTGHAGRACSSRSGRPARLSLGVK